MKRFFIALSLSVCIFAQQAAFAEVPEGYYDNADGKSGYALKTALHGIIKAGFKTVSYDNLYGAYEDTDTKPGTTNQIWDMYSDCNFTHGNKKCGNYSKECDCYNREHSIPQSWFNERAPMKSDLVHVLPTDGYVNNRRSNYPFGEVGSATYTSHNGSKVGTSNFSGYSGTVFEPTDEYKGDFARICFYMVTRYEDVVSSWQHNASAQAMLNPNSNQVFDDWAKNLLMKWHREDPVSDKERVRNEGIQQHQKNRNPFVDYPELAEKIWGGDNTPFYLNPPTVGVEETIVEEELSLSADTYPTAEIISVSGVRLKQVSFSEVNTALDGLARGVYIIRYLHKDGRNFVSRKVVK